MPRRSRLSIPDLPHHIVQRGHNRRVVVTDRYRVAYLETLMRSLRVPESAGAGVR